MMVLQFVPSFCQKYLYSPGVNTKETYIHIVEKGVKKEGKAISLKHWACPIENNASTHSRTPKALEIFAFADHAIQILHPSHHIFGYSKLTSQVLQSYVPLRLFRLCLHNEEGGVPKMQKMLLMTPTPISPWSWSNELELTGQYCK